MKARFHPLLTVSVAALALVSLVMAGCSGSPDPRAILEDCLGKAEEISTSSEALVFGQVLSVRFEGGQGDFEQQAEMAGVIEMPFKEGYESLETWSGSLLTVDTVPLVELSYVTLDGGRTAYIKSSQLEARLGAAGWVYLTPPEEQDPYFDYLETVRSVAGYAEEVLLDGEEEVNGVACWHLLVKPSIDAMLQAQYRNSQVFRDKYQGAGLEEHVREAAAEIWISKDDFLPMRIYNMMVLEDEEAGGTVTLSAQADFGGYGEKPELPVDAPAIYTRV